MRILHLTSEFPPLIAGGLGTAVGGLAVASAGSSMEVGVLLINGRRWPESSEYYGWVSTNDTPERSAVLAQLGASLRFFQLSDINIANALEVVNSWNPEIVHIHTTWLLPIAVALKVRTNVSIVYTVHALYRAENEKGRNTSSETIRRNSWKQEVMLEIADRVIVLSKEEYNLTVRYYPQVRGKLRIVGNGVRDVPWPNGDSRASATTILYVGRMDERKGIQELLDAIPRIHEDIPDARFIFVGGWRTATSKQLRRKWLTDVSLSDESRIDFVGWQGPEDLAQWYSKAHILVVPSRYEPFGIVILEGMLYGLAIAAAAVGGPVEILEHNRTGLLFPPRDRTALADTVVRLAKDPGLRAFLGSAAARDVRDRWLWPTIVARLRTVYEEVLPDLKTSAFQGPGRLGVPRISSTAGEQASIHLDASRSFPFLVGHARSGTTLLRALLDSHSQLAIPWESYFVASLFPKYFDIQAGTFEPAKFLQDLFATPFRFWGISSAEIRSALNDSPIDSYPELIRRIFSRFAQSRGKARYGDKTPGYTRDIGLIGSLLPEAKFIHIIRDGRDVATSLQQVAWGVKDTYEAARSWAGHVGEGISAGQRLGPQRYMEVRYEQLVEAPERTVAEVCQFVGLKFENEMLNYFERASEIIAPDPWPQFHRNLFAPITRGLRNWRRDMPARDVAIFEAVSGELLRELGYELAFTNRRAQERGNRSGVGTRNGERVE